MTFTLVETSAKFWELAAIEKPSKNARIVSRLFMLVIFRSPNKLNKPLANIANSRDQFNFDFGK